MQNEVIADASVLIAFEKLNLTKLLCKLYSTVNIPTAVFEEYQGTIEDCFKIIKILGDLRHKIRTEYFLGRGEIEVIAFAKENNIIALIDDKKG